MKFEDTDILLEMINKSQRCAAVQQAMDKGFLADMDVENGEEKGSIGIWIVERKQNQRYRATI